MQTKTIAAIAILGILMASATTLAFANPLHSIQQSVPSQSKDQKGDRHEVNHEDEREDDHPAGLNLTVGQTIDFSGLVGRYVSATNESVRGNATGSLKLTVTGDFKAGYTFSVTSGTITVGGTTYTISGGSAQSGKYGRELTGQGTAGTGVSFLLRAHIGGNTDDMRRMVMFDLQNGSAEYLVLLRAPTPAA